MAYVGPELKAKLSPTIRSICKKYGVKASLAVHHHSTLVLNIRQSNIDFIGNFRNTVAQRPGGFRGGNPAEKYLNVNVHWYKEHYTGPALAFLSEVIPAMKGPDYFDDSDISTDYFHCSHYVDVKIGRWDVPYALVK